MSSRAAASTIKGYYYQFDTSILKLLELPADSDTITVEGIEDIDLNTATEQTTIQCKYLSKPKFIHSAVREPIILMLDHYVNPSTLSNLTYVLYAHFENETPGNEPSIDITRLKEILTYSKNRIEKHYEVEKGITDTQLRAFLRKFKFLFGHEFGTQQRSVIQKLKAKFTCSDFEADTLYYNNALRIVIDKAIKKHAHQRVITKAAFISQIDCKKKLFNEWFIKLRSKKEYLKLAAQELKSTRALDPIRSKVIVVGSEILSADNTELPIGSFIENLTLKYYKPNVALRDAKPLTIILDCDSTTLINIKKGLIAKEIHFNDGHEHLRFSSTFFNMEPVINKSNNGTKMSKSSFSIRLLSRTCLINNITSILQPSVLMNFSEKDLPRTLINGQYFDFKYCQNLKEIFSLLAP